MKTFLSALLFLLITPSLFSQDCLKATWAKSFGGNSQYNGIVDGGRRTDGNFTVCGSYGDAAFDLGTVLLPDSGYYHYFLGIHDSAGVFSSAKLVAWSNSGNSCVINKIDVGTDNDVYITGYWEGNSVYIANILLPSCTRKRMFVARFDSNLQHKWTRVSDWVSADCQATDVASDLNKNVYVIGSFEDNICKVGAFSVSNYGGWNQWRDDAFLIKFDSLGETQFLEHMGTPNDDAAFAVVADSAGDVTVFGHSSLSSSNFKFDNQIAVPGSPLGTGMFIGKYDGTNGHCIWGKMCESNFSYPSMYVRDACLAEHNNILLCGQITGQFNCYPHSYNSADGNGYLAKFNTNGENLWLKTIGGQNSSETANRVSYFNGQAAVCGTLYSNQPYVGDFPLYSTLSGGSFRAFNAMFDQNGQTLWARGNSITNYYPGSVLIDNSGNQILWGQFTGTQNWYPLSLTNSTSNYKLFAVKFSPFTQGTSFTLSAGPDKAITCGSSVQLSGSITPSSGVPYGWFPDLGSSGNGSKTPTINHGYSADYNFYGTYQGCVLKDTVSVTYTNHDISINASQNLNFCKGDSIQITTTCNQPTATFAWSPAAYINTSTSQNPFVKPPSTTEYIVTATYNGCKAMDTVTVYARNKPYIYLPKQDLYYSYWRTHLCSGDTLPVVFGDPLNLYSTTTPGQLSNFNNNEALLLPVQGILKIIAVSPYGCSNADSISVIVHNNQVAPPVEDFVENKYKCPGDTAEIPVRFTNSIAYSFQYSWYGGWQIDSLDGTGWHDIIYGDNHYEIYNYSVGYPTSTYYSKLRLRAIYSYMDGYKFRPYISDYCSPRGYGNAAILFVGPDISLQPANKTLCEGATDSIAVNSSTLSSTYAWEIKQGNTYIPFVNQPGVMEANDRFLKIINASPLIDSTWVRCRLTGCSPTEETITDSALIRVVPAAQILYQSPNDTVCENDSSSFYVSVNNPSLYTFNWYQNNSPLTDNTAQIWGYNTNTLHFSPVSSLQNNVIYKCEITNTQCSIGIFSTPSVFYVNAQPVINWPGADIDVCAGTDTVILPQATPAGGIYSGTNIMDTIFLAAGLGNGQYPVMYSYSDSVTGCSTDAIKNINIWPLPLVTWTGMTLQHCVYDPPLTLSGGTPTGGTYSGPGVSGNIFDPAIAGTGTHTLTYVYVDTNACIAETNLDFEVDVCTSVQSPPENEIIVRNRDGFISFDADFGTPTFSAELFNIQGQLISTQQFSGSCTQCQLNNIPLPKGLYGILFRNQTMQRFVKVMVF